MLYERAVLAAAMPLRVDVLVPAWLVAGSRPRLGALGVIGGLLLLTGAAMLLDSVFVRFAHEGRGTLAPVDPPRFVVRGGTYRWGRNPMYVANILILGGIAAVFRSAAVLVWGVALFAAFHLFVVSYEEPHLRSRFGEEYEKYCREVGRWMPLVRVRP